MTKARQVDRVNRIPGREPNPVVSDGLLVRQVGQNPSRPLTNVSTGTPQSGNVVPYSGGVLNVPGANLNTLEIPNPKRDQYVFPGLILSPTVRLYPLIPVSLFRFTVIQSTYQNETGATYSGTVRLVKRNGTVLVPGDGQLVLKGEALILEVLATGEGDLSFQLLLG